MENVIIIGTGPAGYTAAIYTARADLKPLIITGTQPGGQLTTTTEVENFPGFPEAISGPDLMVKMQQQAERFGARIEFGKIDSMEKEADGTFTLHAGTNTYHSKAVIICSGASARYLGLPGEEDLVKGGHGLTACATCDGAFYRDVPVCVIGGGDSACEEAMFLTKFASKVYLIHRREELRASKIMAQRLLEHEKVSATSSTWTNPDLSSLKKVPAPTSKDSTPQVMFPTRNTAKRSPLPVPVAVRQSKWSAGLPNKNKAI